MKTLFQNLYTQKLLFLLLVILCFSPIVSSPIALILGLFFTFFTGNPYKKELPKYIHRFLQIAIVGLGFGLKLNEAMNAGKTGLQITILSIATVMLLGYILGKAFKLNQKISYLISSGTAICGGSAIAAIAPIVNPNAKQISLALTIVFALNSIALFVYPAVGHWLHLTQEQFGLWCAVGIHDTSSVVGAASKYGNEALKIATTVKLARALWIIPFSVITMFIFKNKNTTVKVPWFIGLFILAILFNSYFTIATPIQIGITWFAKACLNLTLFFIGTTLSISTLKTIGFKPLLFAILLWLAISIISLLYII